MEQIAVVLLFIAFIFFRVKTQARWYNIPAVLIMIYMMTQVDGNALLILAFITASLVLLIDVFYIKE